MSKYQIPYTNACIRAFGRRFSIPTKEAYRYLRQYQGIAFLIEFYEVEHLQSIEDAADDLLLQEQWRISVIILYHGTYIDVRTIALEKCHPYKDFGKGFI